MIYLVIVAIVVIALFLVIRKSGAADTTIKVTEKKYWEARKNYPGLDEHQYLAAVYYQRSNARAHIKGFSKDTLNEDSYSYTLLFSVLPPPQSIRALSLYITYQEHTEYLQNNPTLIEEYSNLVGSVEKMFHEKPEKFIGIYKTRNPNSASYYNVDVFLNNDVNSQLEVAAAKQELDSFNTIEVNENKDLVGHLAVGIANLAQGIHQEAIQNFNSAIEISDKSSLAYYYRGKTKLGMGDHKDAIDDFDKAIELDAEMAEAYYDRGCSESELKNYTRAYADLSKAIELRTNYESAYIDRAIVKIMMGDEEGAILDCTKAILLEPNNPRSYTMRAFANLKMGYKEAARSDFLAASKLGFTEVDYWIKQLSD